MVKWSCLSRTQLFFVCYILVTIIPIQHTKHISNFSKQTELKLLQQLFMRLYSSPSSKKSKWLAVDDSFCCISSQCLSVEDDDIVLSRVAGGAAYKIEGGCNEGWGSGTGWDSSVTFNNGISANNVWSFTIQLHQNIYHAIINQLKSFSESQFYKNIRNNVGSNLLKRNYVFSFHILKL